jgi:molybdenum ABC transporter molybdate-binding protein
VKSQQNQKNIKASAVFVMNRRSGEMWLSNGWLVAGTSGAVALALTLLLWSPWERWKAAQPTVLRLYCSAGMTKPVAELVKEYETAYGVRTEVSYDGSGKLLSTIRAAGGQGDLYLAAEAAHITIARKEGLIAEVLEVGQLRPVLVVSEPTYRDLEQRKKPVTGLNDLVRDDIRVVLAIPEIASIGSMSKKVLEKAGLWAKIQEKMKDGAAHVSTVGTVNEVAQVVRTRDGYAGIVWTTTAAQFGLRQVPTPELATLVEPLQLAVLAKSRDPTAALRLARFLTSADRGGKVFQKHQFEPAPDADLWEETPALHVAAGAMLRPGIDEVVKAFARREGVTIDTSYNGCGILVGQMKALKSGQPGHFPDAYFACDQSFLTDVAPWFEAGTLVARNRIVLIVPKGNPRQVRSLADLARPELRVGLAHPKNSALGQLTDELLRKLSLHEQVYRDDRAVPVIHTDAAHLLVNQMRAGSLDVAVVYRSNVLSSPENSGHLEVIDLDLPEAVASQPFAVAKESGHKQLMRRLLQALVAPDSARRFRSLGFQWMVEGS